MKSNTLAFAIAAASLGFSTLTLAQDYDRRAGQAQYSRSTQQFDSRDIYLVDHHDDRRDKKHDKKHAKKYKDKREDRRDDRHDDDWNEHTHYGYGPIVYYNARGPKFKRGGYIPREFRNQQYRVVDYRDYRLSTPPRGHQWVQVGADYVLIAIATGIIANIVLNY